MSSSSSSSTNPELIVIAILVLLVVSRIFRNLRGVRVSAGRTVFYILFYFAFGGIFIAASFYEGVSYYYVIPDAIAAIAAGLWAHHFADKRITFWKQSDGSIWYKGGIVIYLIYVVALIARISVDIVVVGPSAFELSPTLVTLSQSAIIGVTVTDLLLALGIGLLMGRNIRVFQRYRLIMSGKETAPEMV